MQVPPWAKRPYAADGNVCDRPAKADSEPHRAVWVCSSPLSGPLVDKYMQYLRVEQLDGVARWQPHKAALKAAGRECRNASKAGVNGSAPPPAAALLAIARAVWKHDTCTAAAFLETHAPAKEWMELAADDEAHDGLTVKIKKTAAFLEAHTTARIVELERSPEEEKATGQKRSGVQNGKTAATRLLEIWQQFGKRLLLSPLVTVDGGTVCSPKEMLSVPRR